MNIQPFSCSLVPLPTQTIVEKPADKKTSVFRHRCQIDEDTQGVKRDLVAHLYHDKTSYVSLLPKDLIVHYLMPMVTSLKKPQTPGNIFEVGGSHPFQQVRVIYLENGPSRKNNNRNYITLLESGHIQIGPGKATPFGYGLSDSVYTMDGKLVSNHLRGNGLSELKPESEWRLYGNPMDYFEDTDKLILLYKESINVLNKDHTRAASIKAGRGPYKYSHYYFVENSLCVDTVNKIIYVLRHMDEEGEKLVQAYKYDGTSVKIPYILDWTNHRRDDAFLKRNNGNFLLPDDKSIKLVSPLGKTLRSVEVRHPFTDAAVGSDGKVYVYDDINQNVIVYS